MKLREDFFADLQLHLDQEPDVVVHGVSLGVGFLIWQWPPWWFVRVVRKFRGVPEPREGKYEIKRRRITVDLNTPSEESSLNERVSGTTRRDGRSVT